MTLILIRRKAEYITNPPPTIEEEPLLVELSYGNPRRRESANMMAPEPFLSKSGESKFFLEVWEFQALYLNMKFCSHLYNFLLRHLTGHFILSKNSLP